MSAQHGFGFWRPIVISAIAMPSPQLFEIQAFRRIFAYENEKTFSHELPRRCWALHAPVDPVMKQALT